MKNTNDKKEIWKNKHPQGKAPLSWDLSDYEELGDEAPACLSVGKTEGEIMEPEDVAEWIEESARNLCVLKEEFPEQFKEQYRNYLLDLEYLRGLDKITQEEFEELSEETFDFGEK